MGVALPLVYTPTDLFTMDCKAVVHSRIGDNILVHATRSDPHSPELIAHKIQTNCPLANGLVAVSYFILAKV